MCAQQVWEEVDLCEIYIILLLGMGMLSLPVSSAFNSRVVICPATALSTCVWPRN